MRADITEGATFLNYKLHNLSFREGPNAAGSDNFTKPRTWPIPLCSVALDLIQSVAHLKVPHVTPRRPPCR